MTFSLSGSLSRKNKVSGTMSGFGRAFLPMAIPFMVITAIVAGCAPQSVVMDPAKAAFETRKTEDQVVDAKIKAGIISRLADIDKSLLIDVNVDVWRSRVMLSGSLSDPATRNNVVRAARQDGRILDFYNHIHLVSETEQAERRELMEKVKAGGKAAQEIAGDIWIETKISALLISEDGIRSVNYRWRSVEGSVYIIGEAASTTELNRVIDIIGTVSGVRSVKSHVMLSPS